MTSVLVKAEIAGELVSGHGLKREEIEQLWAFMMEKLCMSYSISCVITEGLVEFASRCPLRLRTLMNLQHVFLAAATDAFFVSGDKDIVDKTNRTGIAKALTYLDVRAFADDSSSSQSSQE